MSRRHITIVVALAAGLLALAAPTPGSAAVLQEGARGSAVATLNERLAELTYLPAGGSSSRFDRATHHAVLAFQKVHGLDVDGRVGPQTSAASRAARRPAPRLAENGKRAEVWRDRQVAVLIVRGKVTRTVNVSTGRPGFTTPAGEFRVFRREAMSWSVPYSVWLPWAAYFNGGIAFHAHTTVPAYAASHGCVRVPGKFAREVYRFATLGRRVTVL
jgi:peptidoglycan hydrolase-like protein with peptidoglycan-binding domain